MVVFWSSIRGIHIGKISMCIKNEEHRQGGPDDQIYPSLVRPFSQVELIVVRGEGKREWET